LPSASQIAHAGLPFANPMPEAAVDRAIAALPLAPGARVLDTGCGSGELLIRTLRAHPGCSGLGVDLDRDAIAEARRRGAGLPAEFEARDASGLSGRWDAVLNVASSHVHGGFPAALGALLALAPLVLYGEGFWMRRPSPAFLDALAGATEDELPDLDGLRAAVAATGCEILHEELAGAADWARYEEGLAANAERHGGPDAVAYARRIRDRRALPAGGDTLGFGLWVLRRDPLREPVALADPDPEWAARYAAEAARLADALSALRPEIEHIGSTAVPIRAKPIIDVQMAVDGPERSDAVALLRGLGYRHHGQPGTPGRDYLTLRPEGVNVHVFSRDDPRLELNRALRDHLRDHPDSAAAYVSTKEQALRSGQTELLSYSGAKRDCIAQLLRDAAP
jgi:GrpB-like predicted nucleotidyltransferase (UPF0157 family)